MNTCYAVGTILYRSQSNEEGEYYRVTVAGETLATVQKIRLNDAGDAFIFIPQTETIITKTGKVVGVRNHFLSAYPATDEATIVEHAALERQLYADRQQDEENG